MWHILSADLLAMAYQRKARKDQYSNTTVKNKLSNNLNLNSQILLYNSQINRHKKPAGLVWVTNRLTNLLHHTKFIEIILLCKIQDISHAASARPIRPRWPPYLGIVNYVIYGIIYAYP